MSYVTFGAVAMQYMSATCALVPGGSQQESAACMHAKVYSIAAFALGMSHNGNFLRSSCK